MRTASITLIAALFAFACGSDGGNEDVNPFEDVAQDAGTDAWTPVDPGMNDPGNLDPGKTDPGSTDPGANDPGTTDEGTGDTNQPKPMCPCDDSIVAKVCGIDDNTYANDTCAACAICKDLAPNPPQHNGCVGCTGSKDCDPADPLGQNGWIAYKQECQSCYCVEQDECQAAFQIDAPCGPMCAVGTDGKAGTADDVTYATACEMKKALNCDKDWGNQVGTFGACK